MTSHNRPTSQIHLSASALTLAAGLLFSSTLLDAGTAKLPFAPSAATAPSPTAALTPSASPTSAPAPAWEPPKAATTNPKANAQTKPSANGASVPLFGAAAITKGNANSDLAKAVRAIAGDRIPTLDDYQKLVAQNKAGNAKSLMPIGPNHFVMAMCVDHQNNLWVGTEGEGLYRFCPADGLWTQFVASKNPPHDGNPPIAVDAVECGLGDNYVYLWDATSRAACGSAT